MPRATRPLGCRSGRVMWAREGQECKDVAEFQGCAAVLETSTELSEAFPMSPVPHSGEQVLLLPLPFLKERGGQGAGFAESLLNSHLKLGM